MSKGKILLASTSACKTNAVQFCLPDTEVVCWETKSDVPEQPLGRAQIREGALNRLKGTGSCVPAISLESGLIPHGESDAIEITCCIVRTRTGLYEEWSEPLPIPALHYQAWKQLGTQDITFGSHHFPKSPQDWYHAYSHSRSRVTDLSAVVQKVLTRIAVVEKDILDDCLRTGVALRKHKGVTFIDIQPVLQWYPRQLAEAISKLGERLVFDAVVGLDARGFLVAAPFLVGGYPVIMARKKGKLPEDLIVSVTYDKEYGKDSLSVEKPCLSENSRVLVVDDVVATGGSMRAAEELVNLCGGKVVAFIAPYAVANKGSLMWQDCRLRFLFTGEEKQCPKFVPIGDQIDLPPVYSAGPLCIIPPSLNGLCVAEDRLDVKWGRFWRSSNIRFKGKQLKGRDVFMFIDPSKRAEAFDCLQLLSILHRKKTKSITVVCPCLEQGTQDTRDEDEDGYENLAMVDTIGTMVRKHTFVTFDIHAKQSEWCFRRPEMLSLVKELWRRFQLEHPHAQVVFPDAGAAKRFGPLLRIKEPIVFDKHREGTKRIVSTRSAIQPGADFVVVDDLVRSGGTMGVVAKVLRFNQAKRVYALFAHAPFELSTAHNLEPFDDVWTTNSCPRNLPDAWVKVKVEEVLFDENCQ